MRPHAEEDEMVHMSPDSAKALYVRGYEDGRMSARRQVRATLLRKVAEHRAAQSGTVAGLLEGMIADMLTRVAHTLNTVLLERNAMEEDLRVATDTSMRAIDDAWQEENARRTLMHRWWNLIRPW